MDSNHGSVITGVSGTERLPKSCSLLPDPSSQRVRRQRSSPSCPSSQFNGEPFAREENTLAKKRRVSFIAFGRLQFVLSSYARAPGIINYQERMSRGHLFPDHGGAPCRRA
jgi:hypothetical protein